MDNVADDLDLPVNEYLNKHTDLNLAVSLIGYFPATNETLIEGEIWLYRGRDSWNFGLDHIWAGRQLELKNRNVHTVRELINFLILIISKNTPIYPEPKHTKAAVVKSSKGAVIIENISDDYSAVTLLISTVARPLPVEKRWGNRRLNTIKIDCKTI
ncbi:hypothetical protein A1D23_09435 [Chelonobacter oris]|uniref:hypothetical protein n=1 Tax=Chelonobacter oris TaxID=505317 RepID=UPI00244C44CB|nr:hypothetical protein [Chelonobacter oris]MDH3000642.1 hypothetical protein [Chelonobacter oris]